MIFGLVRLVIMLVPGVSASMDAAHYSRLTLDQRIHSTSSLQL